MIISEGVFENLERIEGLLREQKNEYAHELGEALERLRGEVAEQTAIFEEQTDQLGYARAQVNQRNGIIEALSEDVSAIYVVVRDNFSVLPIKQPSEVIGERGAYDGAWKYAKAMELYNEMNVHPEDRHSFREAYALDRICKTLIQGHCYYHHYRVLRDDVVHYFYLKAAKVSCSAGADFDAIMIEFVCEDESKEKETLRSLSELDSMTKLYNRGTGERKTRELIENKQSGLFCMLDIDKFKSINDTYGHAVGDEVIIQVAHELKGAFRNEDIVFRLGGDEFAAFAPGILSRRIGMRILRNFATGVGNISIPALGDRKIEVSIGALLTCGDEVSFEEEYSKVDSAVYNSKKVSGSTITFYPDDDSISL